MRINALSTNFQGNYQRNNQPIRRTQGNQYPQNTRRVQNNQSQQYYQQMDCVEQLDRELKAEKKGMIKGAAIGSGSIAGLCALLQIIHMLSGQPQVSTLQLDNGRTVEDVADFAGIPCAIIERINDADEKDVLDEYIIPEKYNGFEKAIEECEEKLKKDNLSYEEKTKIQDEIAVLEDKQAELDEKVAVYVDPRTDEILIHPYEDMTAGELKEILGVKKAGQFRDDIKNEYILYRDQNGDTYEDYDSYDIAGPIADCDGGALEYKHK